MADDISQMILDCENRESKLSVWEQDFLESIGDRLGRGGSLSVGQVEMLEKIWERVT